jgi:integrase
MSKGFGSIYRRKTEAGATWWVAYVVAGQRFAESSKSDVKQAAKDLLKQRHSEVLAGTFTGPKKPTSFTELVEFLKADYRKKGNKTLKRVPQCVAHLREHFERLPAAAITFERMDRYVTDRLDAGAAAATVRQEMAILGRMLTLAVRAGRLALRPPLPEIEVRNTRAGFFDAQQLQAVLPHLPEHLRNVAVFAYLTGWRRGEVLSLRWANVDFRSQTLRLEPGTTKNDEGRTFPFGMFPELGGLLSQQREATTCLERETGQIVAWVFHHRRGREIRDFYGAWRAACRAAGVPGRIFHDFRRTAVRNLERAGVPRSVAMKLTGHKTESVYRRYAIVDERDLAEGVAKLAAIPFAAPALARSASGESE